MKINGQICLRTDRSILKVSLSFSYKKKFKSLIFLALKNIYICILHASVILKAFQKEGQSLCYALIQPFELY